MTWNPDTPPEKLSPEATPAMLTGWAQARVGRVDWQSASDKDFETALKALKRETNLLALPALELLSEVLQRPDTLFDEPLMVTDQFAKRYIAYRQFVSDTINERKQKGWL